MYCGGRKHDAVQGQEHQGGLPAALQSNMKIDRSSTRAT